MSHPVLNSVRILIVLLALWGIIEGPWWLVALAIFILALRFRAWEAILIGFVADLYWLPTGNPLHTVPFMTLGALVLVWGLEPLRRKFLFTS